MPKVKISWSKVKFLVKTKNNWQKMLQIEKKVVPLYQK